MRKSLLAIISLLAVFFLAAILTGLYPVARVNGHFLLSRAWEKSQKGQYRFLESVRAARKEAVSSGESEKIKDPLEVKKGTLLFLIEGELVRAEGCRMLEGFDALAKRRIADALKRNPGIEASGSSVYGMSASDFRALVLLPQARRDILREVMAGKGKDFDGWLEEAKKKANVTLLLVPFRWEGGEIR